MENNFDGLVSIVLPIFNGEKYMRLSIESVISQIYQNWELIIIDDCSSDSTSQIAQEYSNKDARIRYYRNEENLKLPKSLNRGFSIAKGKYFTWTSDDNLYLPSAIKKMVETLETENADFVFASCNVIDEFGKITNSYVVSSDSIKSIVGTNSVGACFMYTRKVYENIGDYSPDLFLVEDFDYWQRICARFKAVSISDILYEYRFHDGALTSTMKKDVFYRNLEKMLLNNVLLFDSLDYKQKACFYSELHKCRMYLNEIDKDKSKYYFYKLLTFARVEIPQKIKRVMLGLVKRHGN